MINKIYKSMRQNICNHAKKKFGKQIKNKTTIFAIKNEKSLDILSFLKRSRKYIIL